MANKLTGQERIAAAFRTAQQTHTAALMPYYTLGYPDRATSLRVIAAIAPDSDLLELGVPFSDPIADGPTVQRSTQKALRGRHHAGRLPGDGARIACQQGITPR